MKTYEDISIRYDGEWFDAGFIKKLSISILYTKVAGDLTNYPAYIDLSLLGDDFWNFVKNGGGDIRITTSDGTTECPREIVSCDTTAKTGEVHALIPSVSASVDTIIYIYYGNSSAVDYAPTDTYGSQAVWGSNAKYIGHFQANANDSSANAKNGIVSGATLVTGKLGNAYQFDGLSNNIAIDSGANDYDNGLVLAFWVKEYKSKITTSWNGSATTGNTTGDNVGTQRRGRQGVDTPGGTLIDWVVPNTDFGSQSIIITGYQSNTSVVAGTFEIIDETTSEVITSNNLIARASGDSDKRQNSTYILLGQGHSYRVKVYFSNNCDLYINNINNTSSGYDGIVMKGDGGVFGVNSNNANGERVYINNSGAYNISGGFIQNQYRRYVLVYDETQIKTYSDGVLRNTYSYSTNLTQNASQIKIGGNGSAVRGSSSVNRPLWGEVCEVNLRDDPANWTQSYITTEYNNQSDPGSFWKIASIVYEDLTASIGVLTYDGYRLYSDTAVDNILISENTSRSINIKRTVSDSVGASENTNRQINIKRTAIDTVSVSENTNRLIRIYRTIVDSLNLSENIKHYKNGWEIIWEMITKKISSWSNSSKNDTSWNNNSKNNSDWTNKDKSGHI